MSDWISAPKTTRARGVAWFVVTFFLLGCSNSKSESTPEPEEETGAGGTGQTTVTGGSPAAGGIASSTAASTSGGRVASGGSGSATMVLDAFWTQGYDPTKLPDPASGWHHPGKSCVTSGCHDGSNVSARAYSLAGTIYTDNGLGAAVGAEVGVSDGTNSYFVYTANNGNFWLPVTAGSLDMTKADIRVTNAKGQLKKLLADERGADCNSCHSDTSTNPASILILP